jgi:hypothetical protein
LLIPDIAKEIQKYVIKVFFFNHKDPLSRTQVKSNVAGISAQSEELRIKLHMSAFVSLSSVIFALRVMILLQDRMQRYGST